MRRRRAPYAASLLAWIAGHGCADAPPDTAARAAAVVRDSAGITIVENGDPAAAPEWTLSPRPTLDVGSVDGEGPASLYDVAGAATLSTGRVAVLNAGSAEIRIFEPDGAFVKSLGRSGEGPGEFASPVGLRVLPGDSLAVWDRPQRRLTVFGPDGELARTTRIEGDDGNPEVVTILGNGDLIVSSDVFAIPGSGYAPMPYTLGRFTSAGVIADSLPGGVRAEMGAWDLGNGSIRLGTRLFGGFALVAGDEDGYWVGPAREYELVRHDSSGAVTRIVRWGGPDRTVTDADVEADLAEVLARSPEERHEELRRQHGMREVAERFPAYRDLVPASDGGVWVLPYARPRGDPNPPWRVFDDAGRLAARVQLPERFRPFEIGPDHVLGVEYDDLDVERVRRYRVQRDVGTGGGGSDG